MVKVELTTVSASMPCGEPQTGVADPYAAELVGPWGCVEVSVPAAYPGRPGDEGGFGGA